MTTSIYDDARHLVADLAALGGDVAAVEAELLATGEAHRDRPAALVALLLTALAVTFGECLDRPATITTERTNR